MNSIFVVSDNILSPLGSTTAENIAQIRENHSGIKKHFDLSISPEAFYAALLESKMVADKDYQTNLYTRFEKILIASIQDALQKNSVSLADKKTILLISSTKGNIGLLETEELSGSLENRIALHHSAKLVADHFQAANDPIIISQACISGLLGIITATRLLQSGLYENAVIAGADLISRFVLSGFQSFQAISSTPCRPFDADRNGITLGEAAGTVVISTDRKKSVGIQVLGGAVSNDANHISGPSRTGEELYQAIRIALKTSGIEPEDVDFISAHGTATIYNDEMESKAINLAGLQQKPLNSLKGHYGHTLGAAGLIESIISMQSLRENCLFPTLGFVNPGTSKPLQVSSQSQQGSFSHCLKTASGFGGCNAAVIYSKQH
jgi:3-oxoacyl-[acyl-carrier-protein] synthase I